jgi:hypothetical protein
MVIADDMTLASGYCTQLSETMNMYERVKMCSSISSEPAGKFLHIIGWNKQDEVAAIS